MSIPLSLYVHIPWCVKKCPYCDFNSHAVKDDLPQSSYVQALMDDLIQDLAFVQDRPLQSIFFGGGTPSLFAPASIGSIIDGVAKHLSFAPNIEISMEANPGTIEHHNFAEYKTAGINRVSLGIQSFDNQLLQKLGRIHSNAETMLAIEQLHQIQFKTFNLDLMYGLPNQTVEQALHDLDIGIASCAPHLSWYQLTIEPNTVFYKYTPTLPDDDLTWEMQELGQQQLANAGFKHYEVSAYAKPGHACQHNLNYWRFGDYLGIGAGAHGKVTDLNTRVVTRTWKTRAPKDYLAADKAFMAGYKTITADELPGEYMLNRLRMYDEIQIIEFRERTGLSSNTISNKLEIANKRGLIYPSKESIRLTELGQRFLNDVVQLFLQS